MRLDAGGWQGGWRAQGRNRAIAEGGGHGEQRNRRGGQSRARRPYDMALAAAQTGMVGECRRWLREALAIYEGLGLEEGADYCRAALAGLGE